MLQFLGICNLVEVAGSYISHTLRVALVMGNPLILDKRLIGELRVSSLHCVNYYTGY